MPRLSSSKIYFFIKVDFSATYFPKIVYVLPEPVYP